MPKILDWQSEYIGGDCDHTVFTVFLEGNTTDEEEKQILARIAELDAKREADDVKWLIEALFGAVQKRGQTHLFDEATAWRIIDLMHNYTGDLYVAVYCKGCHCYYIECEGK